MNNKDTAIKFLEMCALEDPKAAFAEYINPNFKHHNQYFKGDRDSLMNAMTENSKTAQNKSFNIKQVYETGDRVAVFSQVVKEKCKLQLYT